MPDRLWLDVPHAEKDAAKSAGARWDSAVRRWYAPQAALLPGLARWEPVIPEVLPGEDRTFGQGLFVDLVPSTCWFTNVRSCVDENQWDALRSMVYRRAGNRCEICGAPRGQGRERLEAHERWSFDETTCTQALRRLIALCWSCHRATHFGFAEITGTSAEARAHLQAVNGWSTAEVDAHIEWAFSLWGERSAHDWHLDLSILTNAGIRVVQPPSPRCRSQEGAVRPSDSLSLPAMSGGQGGIRSDAVPGRFEPQVDPLIGMPRGGLWARIRDAVGGH
jgi:Domain of unknown function (DUF5710)